MTANIRYLTVAEAAAELGLTEKTVRNYIASGGLPAYRIGKKIIKIRQEDLDALMVPIEPVEESA